MTKIEQRYNIAHYNKRIKQNRIIESYLINKILEFYSASYVCCNKQYCIAVRF